MNEAGLAPLLACPRCDGRLETVDHRFRCAACRIDFPSLDGIPWLFFEPAVALKDWRGRVDFTMKTLAHEHRQLRDAAKGDGISELTRQRLLKHAAAVEDHASRLEVLLAPLRQESTDASLSTHLAFRTRVSSDQGLMTYAYNIFRDWSWGRVENEAAFAIVRDALGDSPPGNALVLGAGAGRLAYDLHARTNADLTVVLDFNPLLLLVAQRMTRGETIELYEFPLSPRRIEQHAVLRQLSAEASCRDGLCYVFADAQRPPFMSATFDTIVTPWLVDILPERFENLCRRINGLLKESGRWINFGTLSFHIADPAQRYSSEECAEIIASTGFDAPTMQETQMPYLCSPASRHGRLEQVVSWTAVKRSSVSSPQQFTALPDWIVDGRKPVPLLEHFRQQAESTRIRAFVLSLIDGRRSLEDMAQALVDRNLLTFEQAEAAIRAALIKLYESSRRS